MHPSPETLSVMDIAFHEASLASAAGEVPVGAVVVEGASGMILARAHNRMRRDHDPTAHAEMLAIRAAVRHVGCDRLGGCDLYVTLEPCAMCAAALSHARLRRLYYGAYDPKGGGVDHGPRLYDHSTCHHRPEVYGGLQETRCAQLLKDFFRSKRDQKHFQITIKS